MKESYNPHLGTLDQCLETHERLIHKVCQSFTKRAYQNGWEYNDLFQVAVIGFLKAYERFDPTKFKTEEGEGVKFSTYCVPKIFGEIQRQLRDDNIGPKFSRRDKDTGVKIIRMDLVDKPVSEIAEALEISESQAQSGLDCVLFHRANSMNETIYEDYEDDGEAITLLDKLGTDEDYTTVFVEEFLEKLTPKQRKVIQGTMESKTQREIAKTVGVSQAHVSRIIKRIGELYKDYKAGLPLEYSRNELKELEKEKKKHERERKMKKSTKRLPNPANVKARELLKNTNLTLEEIVEQTGVNMNSLRTWAYKIRGTTANTNIQPETTEREVIAMKQTNTQTEKETSTNVETVQEDGVKCALNLSISGECKNVVDLMEHFSKVCETIKTHNLQEFNFKIQIGN